MILNTMTKPGLMENNMVKDSADELISFFFQDVLFSDFHGDTDLEIIEDNSGYIFVDGEEGDYGEIHYFNLENVLLAVRIIEGGDVEWTRWTGVGIEFCRPFLDEEIEKRLKGAFEKYDPGITSGKMPENVQQEINKTLQEYEEKLLDLKSETPTIPTTETKPKTGFVFYTLCLIHFLIGTLGFCGAFGLGELTLRFIRGM